MHRFLLDENDELSNASKHIPLLRDRVADMPETRATFTRRDVDLPNPQFKDMHFEFIKAWPVHDVYDSGERYRYVNPNYIHKKKYSDHLVRCKCGELLSRKYASAGEDIQDNDSHTDDCLPHWRLETRAKLSKRKFAQLVRLGWLGWSGKEISERLGSNKHNAGGWARKLGKTMTEFRQLYRKHAGETYNYLVNETDMKTKDIAEMYGHNRNTLRKWYLIYYKKERLDWAPDCPIYV